MSDKEQIALFEDVLRTVVRYLQWVQHEHAGDAESRAAANLMFSIYKTIGKTKVGKEIFDAECEHGISPHDKGAPCMECVRRNLTN